MFNWNVVQYALLPDVCAKLASSRQEPGHVISDAHIYDRHVDIVKVIERPQYPCAWVTLNPEVKNFYDFTVDDLIVGTTRRTRR